MINEILQGRFPRGLQRFFGIQGDPPVPQLASEIMAGFNVNALETEERYLFDERIVQRFFDVTGDATHPGQVQLYNPTGSGQLLTVDAIYLLETGNSFYIQDANAGTLLTAATTTSPSSDTRWFPRVMSGQIRTDTTINAVGGTVLGIVNPGGYLPFPYVIVPGLYLTLRTGANAQRIAGYFQWRERVMPELEQRF